MALQLQPPPLAEAPISSPNFASTDSSVAPDRRTTFWERAKLSTVGVLDNAYKLSTRREKQASLETCYPGSLAFESLRAAKILRSFTWDVRHGVEEESFNRESSDTPSERIPPEFLSPATTKGLAIFTVFRTGSLFCAVNGSGVVLSRLPDGSWSPPSALLLKSIGFTYTAGVDLYDIVLLLRSEDAVESFFRSETHLGRTVTIAPGPIGSGMLLDDAAELASIWSYSRSKNAHENIKLDGTILTARSDENERAYGRALSAEEILLGAVRPEQWCESLHATISGAEGLQVSDDLLAQCPSPLFVPLSPNLSPPISPDPSIMSNTSRSSFRRLPKEELSEEDLEAKRELEEAMRSFGIDDPTVNERYRMQDPLLVIEANSGEDSLHFDSDDVPGLTDSGRSRSNSPSAPTSLRNSLEIDMNAPTANLEDKLEEDSSASTSAASSLTKPPVPPRRTPRIPAPPSPVVVEPEPTRENCKDANEIEEPAEVSEFQDEVKDNEEPSKQETSGTEALEEKQ